ERYGVSRRISSNYAETGGTMLRTLLESRRRQANNQFGAAASATIHLLLITAAAFATTAQATVNRTGEPPTRLHWVTPRPVTASPLVRRTIAAAGTPASALRLPAISLAIATSIPAIDVPLAVVRNDDFPASTGT